MDRDLKSDDLTENDFTLARFLAFSAYLLGEFITIASFVVTLDCCVTCVDPTVVFFYCLLAARFIVAINIPLPAVDACFYLAAALLAILSAFAFSSSSAANSCCLANSASAIFRSSDSSRLRLSSTYFLLKRMISLTYVS